MPGRTGRKVTAADEEADVVESESCVVCGRAPLVGESVTVVASGRREAAVCDLCGAKPRALSLGEPVRRERVRTAAGAANVHTAFPRPVLPDRQPAAASPSA
jgi:hypothetical protein